MSRRRVIIPPEELAVFIGK